MIDRSYVYKLPEATRVSEIGEEIGELLSQEEFFHLLFPPTKEMNELTMDEFIKECWKAK